ncbi:MAG: tetratricopeptide repeat protein [Thermoplasmata archaeon]
MGRRREPEPSGPLVGLRALRGRRGRRPRADRDGPPPPLTAAPAGDGAWAFAERPRNSYFLSGCRYLMRGRHATAGARFRKALAVDPYHADAMHHLAIVLDATGHTRDALELWEKGVELCKAALPPDFWAGENTLPWKHPGNRPFLRLTHGLGCILHEMGRRHEACEVLEELMRLNPSDEQGVRELLMEIHLDADRLGAAVRLAERFPGDRLPGMVYGRPLAMFRAGAKKEATELLEEAVRLLPRVAEELLKEVHPRPHSSTPGLVTPGGWDEAYDHWLRFGRFWSGEALEWLRETVGRVSEERKRQTDKRGQHD